MKSHRKDWDERIPVALWAYRTTWRNTTGFPPYELVYGKNVFFPIEFDTKTLKTTIEENMELMEARENRMNQSNELDEFSRHCR